jgi:hypothetical protein
MGQARKIRDEYHLPVIAIDYCPPADRACARDTAKRIKAQGLIPYVTDPALSTIGVGRIEVLPRKVLILQERDLRYAIETSEGVRFVAMPLKYFADRPEAVRALAELLVAAGRLDAAAVVAGAGGRMAGTGRAKS